MTLRSHTEAEILAAHKRGEKIWELNSRMQGCDDILIGNDRAEVLQDVIDNEEQDVFDLKGWTLNELGVGDDPLKSIIESEVTFYTSMYEYVADADISHYRMSVNYGETIPFRPADDPDFEISPNDIIEHDGERYVPVCWGETEKSALLESEILTKCWIRYIEGNGSMHVSDGTVYETREQAEIICHNAQ